MKLLKHGGVAIAVVLVVLVLGKLALVRHLVADGTIGPLVLDDELIYKFQALSVFQGDFFSTTRYPPLYSFFLSLAFFSRDNWYAWMLFINVLLSSLVLVPVWLISLKFLPGAASFAVVLITALSSFQVYYPMLVMSENLHTPLFSLSILLLMRTGSETRTRNIVINTLFGVSMALGYLTKYLYVVAMPALVLLWWIKPLFHDNPAERRIGGPSRLADFLAVFGGFVLTYVPWLICVHYSGAPVLQGMGADFVRSGIRDFATLRSLALWVSFYISYTFLALAPFLLGFLLYLLMQTSGTVETNRRELFFMVTVVLVSFMFLSTAIQHSWRAGYNYPEPNRVMGRYVMHVIPLWLIAFMIALNKIRGAVGRVKLSQLILSSMLCSAALFFALVMFIVIKDSDWLGFSFMNSPDGVMYMSKPFILFSFIILLSMAATLAAARRRKDVAKRLILLFSFFLLLLQTRAAHEALDQTLNRRHDFQLHGRQLSPFVQSAIKGNPGKITLISNDPEFHSPWLPASIAFWLYEPVKEPPVKFATLTASFSDTTVPTDEQFIITRRCAGNPLYRYTVEGRGYCIYDVGSWVRERSDLKSLQGYEQ